MCQNLPYWQSNTHYLAALMQMFSLEEKTKTECLGSSCAMHVYVDWELRG